MEEEEEREENEEEREEKEKNKEYDFWIWEGRLCKCPQLNKSHLSAKNENLEWIEPYIVEP